MKLSVITICFNEKEIRRTCESIVHQSWQNFEWIVIDGGSTDGTLDIINEYKDRINILISEKDNGIYNALNKGIKLATGEWLSFMNGGDCFYDNDVLKNVFAQKQDFSKISVIYGNTGYFNSTKIQKWKPVHSKYFFIRRNINHQSSFTRKSLFEKYGYFDESFKICADFDKWCQFLTHGEKFKKLDLNIALFDINGISSNTELSSIERSTILKKYYSPIVLFLEKVRKCFSFSKLIKEQFHL